MGIRRDDIKHASVISGIENRLICRNVFIPYECYFDAAEKKNRFKSPLNETETSQIGFLFIETSGEDPFKTKVRETYKKEQRHVQHNNYKTKHRITSKWDLDSMLGMTDQMSLSGGLNSNKVYKISSEEASRG